MNQYLTVYIFRDFGVCCDSEKGAELLIGTTFLHTMGGIDNTAPWESALKRQKT